ncbi:MAG TPA: hypothetical protein PKZ99_08585 [Azospirillaceae bacterium]|nr:hypothetical protein [Azospirillaceae bacterium]
MTGAAAAIGSDDATAPMRLIGKIPVRNLWLLMMYAADFGAVARSFHGGGRKGS